MPNGGLDPRVIGGQGWRSDIRAVGEVQIFVEHQRDEEGCLVPLRDRSVLRTSRQTNSGIYELSTVFMKDDS